MHSHGLSHGRMPSEGDDIRACTTSTRTTLGSRPLMRNAAKTSRISSYTCEAAARCDVLFRPQHRILRQPSGALYRYRARSRPPTLSRVKKPNCTDHAITLLCRRWTVPSLWLRPRWAILDRCRDYFRRVRGMRCCAIFTLLRPF